MVRATYARVLVRLGGAYPSGWVEAAVTNLCTQADYILDGYTYPTTLSTSDNKVIEVCVDIVLRMMRIADLMQEAGGTAGHSGRAYPSEFAPISKDIKERIDALMSDTTYDGFTTTDMVEDS